MVKIVKYDRNGRAEKHVFPSLARALSWLMIHFKESEWCWVAYNRKENEYV